jgi:AbrB family looped-hinge helix DNA binding protein
MEAVMPTSKARATTKVSSRGQVVLPAAIRASRHWDAGTELEVIERGDEVVLRKRSRREEKYPPITWEEFLSRLPKYEGPPLSDKDIEDAISRSFAEEWRAKNGG